MLKKPKKKLDSKEKEKYPEHWWTIHTEKEDRKVLMWLLCYRYETMGTCQFVYVK